MLKNRIIHGILPALLMSLSVGQIYAFTLFSTAVSESLHTSQQAVQFAFSLGIFFLGMGAAFFGKIVENRIKLAAIIGSVLFLSGLAVTHLSVLQQSLWMLYLGYGLLLGLGTGTIYITPVKTLMMWFPKHKAVAGALPIIGFGLGSSICTTIHDCLRTYMSSEHMFLSLSGVYLLPMLLGCLILRKPNTDEKIKLGCSLKPPPSSGYKFLKTSYFWRCWAFMLINISAGLCLIPLAKQMMTSYAGYTTALISAVLILMGIMNGAGRFLFAWLSDKLSVRTNILYAIVLLSILMIGMGFFPPAIGLALVVISACYGAGFSCIPSIIHDHYGISNVSTVHGAVLSAWGVAGLLGNQLAMVAMDMSGMYGVLGLVALLHCINLWNICKFHRRSNG